MTDTTAGPVARSSVARVGLATAITAVCGYAVLYLAARKLDPTGFAVFGVFWGAFGLVTGAANGLLQEATRRVRFDRTLRRRRGPVHPSDPGRHRSRCRGGGVVAGTSPLWAPHVFAEERALSVALLAVGLAGFCLHATLLGMLAGTGHWTQYGSLMVTDAVIRVVVAAAAFLLGWGLAGFLWATVAGAVAAAAAGGVGEGYGRPRGCAPRAARRRFSTAPRTRSRRRAPARSW